MISSRIATTIACAALLGGCAAPGALPPTWAAAQQAVPAVSFANPVHFAVSLPLRNEAELRALMDEVAAMRNGDGGGQSLPPPAPTPAPAGR